MKIIITEFDSQYHYPKFLQHSRDLKAINKILLKFKRFQNLHTSPLKKILLAKAEPLSFSPTQLKSKFA